jgi:hypothetical protein
MNKLFPIALALFLLPSMATFPAAARSSKTLCANTLKSVKSAVPSVKVFQMTAIPTEMGRPPRGRSKYLVISVQGIADKAPGHVFMNTAAKQKAIAQKVVKNCSQVGLVSFNLYESDWVNMYGIKNGKVQPFTCREMGSTLTWGQYGCL